MNTYVKIAIFLLLGFAVVELSKDHFKTLQDDESWYTDYDKNGQHDSTCTCDYCLECGYESTYIDTGYHKIKDNE